MQKALVQMNIQLAHTYRYYLTRLGRSAIAAAGSLTRFNIVPAMAGAL